MDRLDELMGLEQSSDVVNRAMETSDFESAVAHVQVRVRVRVRLRIR